MSERGAIRSPEQRQQLADFRGLRLGNITPTDIDGFFEIRGRLFVFIEGKHGSAAVPFGQKLAIERLCDALKLPSVGFIVRHNTAAPSPIAYHAANVSEYRWRGRWLVPQGEMCLRDGISHVLRLVLKEDAPQFPVDAVLQHAEWIAEYDDAVAAAHWTEEA